MSDINLNRRQFLATSAAAGMMALNHTAPSYALPGSTALQITPQKKALVFIMLDGGNDSYNMLVPIDDLHHRQYAETRSNLAHGQWRRYASPGCLPCYLNNPWLELQRQLTC